MHTNLRYQRDNTDDIMTVRKMKTIRVTNSETENNNCSLACAVLENRARVLRTDGGTKCSTRYFFKFVFRMYQLIESTTVRVTKWAVGIKLEILILMYLLNRQKKYVSKSTTRQSALTDY